MKKMILDIKNNIQDNDIICYLQGKNIIINEIKETIIKKFIEENVDILFSAQLEKSDNYDISSNITLNIKSDNKSEHKNISSTGFIGFKNAIYTYLCWQEDKNFECNILELNMKLDTKTTIFLNMLSVNFKDILIKNGKIYNRILEETSSIVNFNEEDNIIPIIMEKMKNSLHVHLHLNITNKNTKPQIKTQFNHTEQTLQVLSMLNKIIYINLDKRTDRREEIEDELIRYGLLNTNIKDNLVERFPAVSTPGRGILGCTYSHLEVCKLARNRGYKNILILEDDFIFLINKKEFYENLDKLFTQQIKFDVCMLAYNNIQPPLPTEYHFLMKTVEAQTASAYILNESVYEKFIELYEWAAPLLEQTGQHWIYANDQIWKKLQSDPNINWYCFKERIGKQQDGYSDNSEQFVELQEN